MKYSRTDSFVIPGDYPVTHKLHKVLIDDSETRDEDLVYLYARLGC